LARLRPVERLDAEAVAYQEQGVFLFVIKCEGELAAQRRQRAGDAEAGVKVQHQFGIALAAKASTLRREIRADALVVVQLPVLGQHEAFVRGAERLPPALFIKVDDRQAGMTEADTGL